MPPGHQQTAAELNCGREMSTPSLLRPPQSPTARSSSAALTLTLSQRERGQKTYPKKSPLPRGRGKTVRALNLAPMPSKGESSGVSEIVAHGTSHNPSPSAHRRHMYLSGFTVGGQGAPIGNLALPPRWTRD